MRNLDEIISGSLDVLAPLLTEAFEAGRAVGRHEANRDFKAKLTGFLSEEEPDVTSVSSKPAVAPTDERTMEPIDRQRAAPGSVKPTISRLVSDAPNGLTPEDIVKTTGFKFNSVRGTLWTLGNEGTAQKRDGRWFRVRKAGEIEAANVEHSHAPLAASHDLPREPGQHSGP